MAAQVEMRVEPAGGANDDDALARDLHDAEGTCALQAFRTAGVEPLIPKDRRALAFEKCRVNVRVTWKRDLERRLRHGRRLGLSFGQLRDTPEGFDGPLTRTPNK